MTDQTSRSRIRASERRQRQITLRCRVLPAEQQEIKKRAKALDVSVSALLRESALDTPLPRPRKRLPTPERQDLARLAGQLGKIGSNLNQIARVANSEQRLDDLPLLEEDLGILRGILAHLMRVLR